MTKQQVYNKVVAESEKRRELGETCRANIIANYLDGKINSGNLSDTECVVSSMFRYDWEDAV